MRISSGSDYADARYIRLNYACPRRRLEEALRRIAKTVSGHRTQRPDRDPAPGQ